MVDNDCDCHMMIEDVSVSTNNNGTSVKCKLSVLNGTDRGQIGKTVSEFFGCDGNTAGMFLNLAQAAGLITAEQRKVAADSGVGMNIDEALLKGRQVCAKIRMKPNMIKDPVTGAPKVNPEKPGPYPRIGFDTFAVWDAKANGIPKDPQFLPLQMQHAPRGATAQQPAQQTQAAQQPSASAQPTASQTQTPPPAASEMSMNW
jgi:hypothetical protein